MKRYWKLILLSVVILLTISIFYVRSYVTLSSHFPELVFDGEGELTESIKIYGYVYDESLGSSDFLLTADGPRYYNDIPFLESLSESFYMAPAIQNLQIEQRSFMRGKYADPQSFFEDEETVAYVEISGFDYTEETEGIFNIEVLDKASGNKNAFSVSFPDVEHYDYAYVTDVQVVNGKLKVASQNSAWRSVESSENSSQGSYIEEVHIYQFDLDNQRLVGHETIEFSDDFAEAENIDPMIEMINNRSEIGSEEYLLVKQTYQQDEYSSEGNEEDDSTNNNAETNYFFYNYSTNEQGQIELDADSGGQLQMQALEGTVLYDATVEGNELQVQLYDIENGIAGETISVELPDRQQTSSVDSGAAPDYFTGDYIMQVKDGLIFLMNAYASMPDSEIGLVVLDTESGSTVYQGTVTTKESNSDAAQDLNIFELFFD